MNNQTIGHTLLSGFGMLLKGIGIIIGIVLFGAIKAVGFVLWRFGNFFIQKLVTK